MSAIIWDWNWRVLLLIHIFSVYTDKYGNKYVCVGGWVWVWVWVWVHVF